MLPGTRRRELHRSFAVALSANDPLRAAAFPEIVADDAVASGHAALIVPAAAWRRAWASCAAPCSSRRCTTWRSQPGPLVTGGGGRRPSPPRRLADPDAAGGRASAALRFLPPETMRSLSSSGGVRRSERRCGEGTDAHARALRPLRPPRHLGRAARQPRDRALRWRRVAEPREPHQATLRLVNACAQAFYSGALRRLPTRPPPSSRALDDRAPHGSLFLSVGADPLVSVMTAEANVLGMRGDATGVRALTDRGDRPSRGIGAALQKPWVLIFNAMALYGAGELDRGRGPAGRRRRARRQPGRRLLVAGRRLWLCVLASERGDPETGPVGLTALMAQADAVGIGISRPFLAACRPPTSWVRAAGTRRGARPRCLPRGGPHRPAALGADIWRRCAEVHFARGEIREGRSCGRIALAFAEANATEPMAVRCRGTLARLSV